MADYTNAFRKLQAYLGDPERSKAESKDALFAGITADQVKGFLGDLSTPRAPNRAAKRPAKGLSNKTILNIHTALSALWTWAIVEGIVSQHILHQIPRPKPEKRAITPFSEADITTLLVCGKRSRAYTRPGKRTCDHAVATALCNRPAHKRAPSSCCCSTPACARRNCSKGSLAIHHADLNNKRILVLGKGPLCEELGAADLPAHGQDAVALPDDRPLRRTRRSARSGSWAARATRTFGRDALLKLPIRLGTKAGVKDYHPHRFHHTFAVNFLRNGGNAFELQMALGHTTLQMVQTYLALAQADLDAAHRKASPVENWRL